MEPPMRKNQNAQAPDYLGRLKKRMNNCNKIIECIQLQVMEFLIQNGQHSRNLVQVKCMEAEEPQTGIKDLFLCNFLELLPSTWQTTRLALLIARIQMLALARPDDSRRDSISELRYNWTGIVLLPTINQYLWK